MNDELKENDWSETQVYADVRAYNDSKGYTFALSNNIVIKISPNFESKLMTCNFIMPASLAGKLEGLMGKMILLAFS